MTKGIVNYGYRTLVFPFEKHNEKNFNDIPVQDQCCGAGDEMFEKLEPKPKIKKGSRSRNYIISAPQHCPLLSNQQRKLKQNKKQYISKPNE